MLNKIFGNKKPNNISTHPTHARAPGTTSGPVERKSRALKIIHAGGHAEHHYMAIPASSIIDKYPSFILARPEIFRRPWDSIVRPDEILVPGQKFYIVPRQTVRKLRRRIKKIGAIATDPGFSLESKLLVGNADSKEKDNLSISGILVKPGLKVKARNRHVRFFGIETTNQKPSSGSVPSDRKSGKNGEKGSKERVRKPQMDEEKRRARNEDAWEPSLNSINE